jgi:pimeloyl-ACP methyl ester carboxylesterase
MEYGLNDEVSNVWANEQSYHSALRVYTALGQPTRLGLMRLPGFHGANDQELCLDWLDIQFGRSAKKWTNDLLFPWSYDDWHKKSGTNIPPVAESKQHEQGAGATRAAITWMLGDAPPKFVATGPGRGGFPGRGPSSTATKPVANPGQLAPDVPGWVIARGSQEFGWLAPEKDNLDSKRIRFGAGITGDLYFAKDTPTNAKLPVVIWLHGYSYPLGYMWVYRRDLHPILALMKAGYAVLAFDQCGFGARQAEIGPFYDRTPRWSQLGRMVDDVRTAIDALEKEPLVDAQRVALFGYTLGGMVALHTAALDPRVQAVVSISGFTPWRIDTRERGTGGIARYSHERPLLPRLGLFIGREKEIPYDYDDLIAALAPRPVLIVQPTMDRDATPADVRTAVETARKTYAQQNAADKLTLHEPVDYQRLTTVTQNAAIEWLKGQR